MRVRPDRALLDANVLISSLLSSRADSAPYLVLQAALDGAYTLILPERVAAEVAERVRNKPFLDRQVPPEVVDQLIQLLRSRAETVPDLDQEYPEVGPDRQDDFLFTHAVVGEADYLVSGDRGGLSVGRIGSVEIVSPARFVAILRAAGHLPGD